MAYFETSYTLTDDEKNIVEGTCKILSHLSKNTTLNANFNFSLIEDLLKHIIANNNNKMRF